jgi:hypothetical protein
MFIQKHQSARNSESEKQQIEPMITDLPSISTPTIFLGATSESTSSTPTTSEPSSTVPSSTALKKAQIFEFNQ